MEGLKTGVKGKGKSKRPEQISLTDGAATLMAGAGESGEHIKAYLIGPSGNEDFDPSAYAGKFDSIKRTVGDIIPALKVPDQPTAPKPWTDIRYDPKNLEDVPLWKTPDGTLLFKYDPNHAKKKKAAFWVESNRQDIHMDVWN